LVENSNISPPLDEMTHPLSIFLIEMDKPGLFPYLKIHPLYDFGLVLDQV
jgi:hypothetical protein